MGKPPVTLCLWYDKDAEEAAQFYAATFPDSSVGPVHRAPGDFPGGKQGDALTVEFTVLGIPCVGLNGGPIFPHSEAFSFQVVTEDQAETDRLWQAVVGHGKAAKEQVQHMVVRLLALAGSPSADAADALAALDDDSVNPSHNPSLGQLADRGRRNLLKGGLGLTAIAFLGGGLAACRSATGRESLLGFEGIPPKLDPAFDGVEVAPGYNARVFFSWGDAVLADAARLLKASLQDLATDG